MPPRVASILAFISRTGFRNPGRPAYSLYQYRFPTGSQVAPITRLPAFAGDGSPVRTESRILRRPWRRISGFPRVFALQCRLSMSFRVAPNPASSGFAEVESPGCPEASFSSARRLVAVRVSPLPTPSGDASGEFPGRPGSSLLWLRLLWSSESPRIPHPSALPVIRLWVAPRLQPSAASASRFPGSPRFLVSSSAPAMEFRVAPLPRILRVCRIASSRFRESCFNGRSDDESRFLELCIPWVEPADESSCQPVQALSGLTLDARSISFGPSLPEIPFANRRIQLMSASSCQVRSFKSDSGLHPATERPVRTRFRYACPNRLSLPLNVSR